MEVFDIIIEAQRSTIPTAIGTVPIGVSGLVSYIARIAVGVGGFTAVALLAFGGFTVLTSSGDPERLNTGKEIITNALMGLSLIVLSVFVLQFLGWDVLGIGRWVDFSQIGN